MRIACALGETVPEALELYRLLLLPRIHAQLADAVQRRHPARAALSCFLLDSPQDSLESIYAKYTDIAMLSKFSGGIGIAYHRVRSRGSLIAGTNGHSNGIVPWLKTLDASVAAVNQGGKRKGAACVYLEPWHADIEEFLELRDNTGDEARARTTSTSRSGCRTSSCARRGGRRLVASSTRRPCRTSRPLRRRVRGRLRGGRSGRHRRRRR